MPGTKRRHGTTGDSLGESAVPASSTTCSRPLSRSSAGHCPRSNVRQILSWYEDKGYSESIILEALKRAVLRGVINLNYIDRILAQWSKKNLRTAQEVNSYEEQFRSSRTTNKSKNQSDREARIKDKEEKYKDLYMS